MIRFRPLPLMTLLTFAALIALVVLGRWQWDKYVLKSRAAHEPVAQMTISGYQPVLDGIQFVFGVRPDTHEEGWRVFAPVQYGATTVFVDADFITQVQAPRASEVRFRCQAFIRPSAVCVDLEVRHPRFFQPAFLG